MARYTDEQRYEAEKIKELRRQQLEDAKRQREQTLEDQKTATKVRREEFHYGRGELPPSGDTEAPAKPIPSIWGPGAEKHYTPEDRAKYNRSMTLGRLQRAKTAGIVPEISAQFTPAGRTFTFRGEYPGSEAGKNVTQAEAQNYGDFLGAAQKFQRGAQQPQQPETIRGLNAYTNAISAANGQGGQNQLGELHQRLGALDRQIADMRGSMDPGVLAQKEGELSRIRDTQAIMQSRGEQYQPGLPAPEFQAQALGAQRVQQPYMNLPSQEGQRMQAASDLERRRGLGAAATNYGQPTPAPAYDQGPQYMPREGSQNYGAYAQGLQAQGQPNVAEAMLMGLSPQDRDEIQARRAANNPQAQPGQQPQFQGMNLPQPQAQPAPQPGMPSQAERDRYKDFPNYGPNVPIGWAPSLSSGFYGNAQGAPQQQGPDMNAPLRPEEQQVVASHLGGLRILDPQRAEVPGGMVAPAAEQAFFDYGPTIRQSAGGLPVGYPARMEAIQAAYASAPPAIRQMAARGRGPLDVPGYPLHGNVTIPGQEPMQMNLPAVPAQDVNRIMAMRPEANPTAYWDRQIAELAKPVPEPKPMMDRGMAAQRLPKTYAQETEDRKLALAERQAGIQGRIAIGTARTAGVQLPPEAGEPAPVEGALPRTPPIDSGPAKSWPNNAELKSQAIPDPTVDGIEQTMAAISGLAANETPRGRQLLAQALKRQDWYTSVKPALNYGWMKAAGYSMIPIVGPHIAGGEAARYAWAKQYKSAVDAVDQLALGKIPGG